MADLATLKGEAVATFLHTLGGRATPVKVTARVRNRWLSLDSRIEGLLGEYVLIDYPQQEDGNGFGLIRPGTKVGISVRHKRRKYMFGTAVHSLENSTLHDGQMVRLLALRAPELVLRASRRAQVRVPVPGRESVRVTFWPGGREVEPELAVPEIPIWSGAALDLSLGGMLVRVPYRDAAQLLAPGDLLGIRLMFEREFHPIAADATLCHYACEGEDGAVFGFRLAVTDLSEEALEDLRFLGGKIAEYSRR